MEKYEKNVKEKNAVERLFTKPPKNLPPNKVKSLLSSTSPLTRSRTFAALTAASPTTAAITILPNAARMGCGEGSTVGSGQK